MDATAEASFAARRALIKLGIAIAAIIRIMAITINNSILQFSVSDEGNAAGQNQLVTIGSKGATFEVDDGISTTYNGKI